MLSILSPEFSYKNKKTCSACKRYFFLCHVYIHVHKMKMFSSVYFIISIPSVSRKIKYPAAADFIFLLTLGMEIMKYTLENIFILSYYGVNNNITYIYIYIKAQKHSKLCLAYLLLCILVYSFVPRE